ncbi:MAG: MFS transporter [Anaerolineales bacterium]
MAFINDKGETREKSPSSLKSKGDGIHSGHLLTNPLRVLMPLGLGTALSLMGDATLYTVLPTHTAEAGISLAAVGIILSANRIVRLFLNGPTGLAYDRSHRRRLFIPALFIGALSTAIYAATSGFWPLLMGRLLWGLAWSGIWVGGATIILDTTTYQDRGRWTGLYQIWFFLGIALGSLFGGTLTDLLGYQETMWVAASVGFISFITALIFLPETRHVSSNDPKTHILATPTPWRSSRQFWAAISIQGINRFVTAGVLAATMALLVQEQLGVTNIPLGIATATGILMAGRTLLGILAAPLAGVASDKIGSRRRVTSAGLFIGMIGMFLVSRDNPHTILIGIVLGAIAGSSLQALTTAIVGDTAGDVYRGRAIGLLHTSGDLGSALGPLVAYALLPWIGLSGVYTLCASLFLLGLILNLGLGQPKHE